MVAQPTKTGVAEFLAQPEDGNRHELVRGEVRVMPPPQGSHGFVETALLARLDRYLDECAQRLGWDLQQGLDARSRLVGFVAGGEFGLHYALPDDPDQIRGADGVYISSAQLARTGWTGTGYFPEVPVLVIGVVSPSERADDVAEKVQDYLAGGARRVWCVYPARRFVQIYAADAATRFVRGEASLTNEEILPGFALSLGLIFP
ncbi:MAG TPA: Uma2 family endonuclease, partial [Chloroflexota bacterium]|nr:Uma2 family endonuclease [Chloroflexota bacterium]